MPEFKHFPKTHVACITEKGDYNQAIPRGFARLFAWLGAKNIQPIGPSFVIHSDHPERAALTELQSKLCVPIADQPQSSEDIEVKDIDAFEAATAIYQGAQNAESVYQALYGWIDVQGYRDCGDPLEQYKSVPGEELCVEVYIPIQKIKKPVRPRSTLPKTRSKVGAKRRLRKPTETEDQPGV
jgi:effector-binding domain-containing protein